MRKYRLRLLAGIGLLTCVGAAVAAAVYPGGAGARAVAAVILLLPGVAIMVYAAVRTTRFFGRLKRFAGYLLAGNYEAGVQASGDHDEVFDLEQDLDRLAEQLRAYDQLRADRVRYNQLLVDLVFDHVSDPVLVMDVQKEDIECNPAAQTRLGSNQRKINLGALEKIETNAAFIGLLRQAMANEGTLQEGRISLRLPGGSAVCEVDIHMHPVKDKHEKVMYVLMLCGAPREGERVV